MSTESSNTQLPAVGILSELSPDNLSFLASYGKFVRPAPDEVVIEQGQPQDSLYVILMGNAHVTATSGDRTMLVKQYHAGDAFGEVNLFDPGVASASVIAKSDCIIWKISGSEINGFFEADPAAGLELTKALLHKMCHDLRAMNTKLGEQEAMAAIKSIW